MRIQFKTFCVLVYAVLPLAVWAQKDAKQYKQESEFIKKEIWGWEKPEFNVRNIPTEFANASRVVIARHIDITTGIKKRSKFTGLGFTMYRELMMTEVLREVVKVNDKAAVSDYSEFSFTQLERRNGTFMDKKSSMYIGVKVIKPNGSIKEVDADEIVLTKDEKKDKEAKVAVPDLQPGDIIDYFIAKQTNMTQENAIPPFTFTFFDDNPILSYSIHCEIGIKYAVEYRNYNGAPDFEPTKGEDNVMILDAVKKNIPATAENNLWVAPYRQLPIIRMNIMVGYDGMFAGRVNARKPGHVYKNQSADEFVEDEMNAISLNKYQAYYAGGDQNSLGEASHNYVKKLKKDRKNIPDDSFIAELYYAYRFSRLVDFYTHMGIEHVVNRLKRPLNSSQFLFDMGLFFKNSDVENKLVLLTSKYGPDMKSIMNKDDLTYMLLVEGTKPRIFGISDVFSPAFYIPSYYENTKQALTLDIGGKRDRNPKSFEKGSIGLGCSRAEENLRLEQLTITPDLTKTAVNVSRNTTLRGHYKSDTQKELVLFEDFYEQERLLLGEKKSLIMQFEADRRSKKYADELKTAFAEARKKQKDAFEADARNWFEQEVTNLTNYKITNLGIRHTNPDFVYSSQFNMEGLLKKAGNNYILEVGKLQGSPLKVEDAQRNRNLDVYAPFARSINYDITLNIPEGYTVEGVDNLNKKVENSTGGFICEAKNDEKTVQIKVSKVYRNPFEPVANWKDMLAFIDAANEWSSAKLLLKKK